jgi:hypothetical protein
MSRNSSSTVIDDLAHISFGAKLWILAAGLLVCLSTCSADALTFTDAQRTALARLVQTDPEAAKLFRKYQRLADESIDDTPMAVKHLATAGRLASDPDKIASRQALEDMRKLEALGYAAVVTSNAAYGAAARRLILGWAQTYAPAGQPVDETKLEPLFTAYGLTRAGFTVQERKTVEAWLRLIAQRQCEPVQPGSVTASNNWQSHRLKIVGSIGYLLEDRELIAWAEDGFKQQVGANLHPDGSSLDFHERDALHYHCYDLEPLLTLALAASQRGVALYDYRAPNGASLRQAVQFLVPYCNGTATHAEWVHSQVAFDRARAEAGEEKFAAGSLFDPRGGLRALALASYFDGGLETLVGKLAGRERPAKFAVWQSVLNQVLQTGRPS